MRKLALPILLGCLVSCAVAAGSGSNTVDKLNVMQAAFLDALSSVQSSGGQTNADVAEKLRKELGLFVSTVCGHPPSTDSLLTESDANIVEFTYAAFISDLEYLQRISNGSDGAPLKMITRRVNSLVSSYPLASRPYQGEHRDMILFLAYASNTNADDVRSAVKSRIEHLGSADQLPFLVVLSKLSDKAASETLIKNASKEAREFESLFSRLYKNGGASP